MTPNEAARSLAEKLGAPSWAVVVSAWRANGRPILIVRVDPKYRKPVSAPASYKGYQVSVNTRLPSRNSIGT